MRVFLITTLALAALGLGLQNTGSIAASGDAHPRPVRLVESLARDGAPAGDIRVRNATIDGDVLTVAVTYPGGCRVHGFRLEAAADTASGAGAEARLVHDAYGDRCQVPVNASLRFDLTPMARAAAQSGEDAAAGTRIRIGGVDLHYAL